MFPSGETPYQIARKNRWVEQKYVLYRHGALVDSKVLLHDMVMDNRHDLIQKLMESLQNPKFRILVNEEDTETQKPLTVALSGAPYPNMSLLVSRSPSSEEDTRREVELCAREVSDFVRMTALLLDAGSKPEGDHYQRSMNRSGTIGMSHWVVGESELGLALIAWVAADTEDKLVAEKIVKRLIREFGLYIVGENGLSEVYLNRCRKEWNSKHKDWTIRGSLCAIHLIFICLFRF